MNDITSEEIASVRKAQRTGGFTLVKGQKQFSALSRSDEDNEIVMYDEIGNWGTTAEDFRNKLKDITGSMATVRINSPGGDVFDGLAIGNIIRSNFREVTVYIDGLAASIATLIAIAGDRVVMASDAAWMIHSPWTFAMGSAKDMEDTIGVLRKVEDILVGRYVAKTKQPEDKIRAWMEAETWFTAQEALDAGFIDEIAEDSGLENMFAMSGVYAKVPDRFNAATGTKSKMSEREVERLLREEAGFSRTEAKAMVSLGYKAPVSQRDAEGENTAVDLGAVLAQLQSLQKSMRGV